MSWLHQMATKQLTSQKWDVQFGQRFFFVLAPVVFLLAVKAVSRFATTQGEIVNGLLGAISVSLLCVLIGLVLPLANRKSPPST